jgi:hypothetical protein
MLKTPSRGFFFTAGTNGSARFRFVSHKKHLKIFEFNKFAYLCLPKKTGG